LLTPASILIWTGIYVFVRELPFISAVVGGTALFALFAGFAFFTIYVLSGRYAKKWPLYIAFVAIAYFVIITAFSLLMGLGSVIGAVIILAGLYILYREIRKG